MGMNFMKRNLFIHFCFFILISCCTSVYAKETETQLTDYRYENIYEGSDGYFFADAYDGNYNSGFLGYNDGEKTSYYPKSVILRPNGTEIFEPGKYGVSYCTDDAKSEFEYRFPQYENMFIVTDYNNSQIPKDKIIDTNGNVIFNLNKPCGTFLDRNTVMYDLRLKKYSESDNSDYCVLSCSGIENPTDNITIFPNDFTDIQYAYWYDIKLNPAKGYYQFNGVDNSTPSASAGIVIDKNGNQIKNEIIDDAEFMPISYEIHSNSNDNGYFFKKKILCGKEYFALFKSENEFSKEASPNDTPSEWAKSQIEHATADGLLYNNANCRFKDPITRRDFCIIAVETFCKSQGMEIDEYIEKNSIELDYHRFIDTDNAYILLAEKLGIVKGMSENTFAPNEYITRQQAAVMLSNMAKLSGLEENADRVNFTDTDFFADWAKEAILNVSAIKNPEGTAIMAGTEPDKFSPWMYYSREQAYVTIYRLYNICNNDK